MGEEVLSIVLRLLAAVAAGGVVEFRIMNVSRTPAPDGRPLSLAPMPCQLRPDL